MPADDEWKPCPSGTIQNIVDEARKSEQQSTMTRRTLIGGAVASIAGVGVFLLNHSAEANALTCREVKGLADDFVHDRLDSSQHALVEAHCKTCQPCAQFIQRLTADKSSIG